MFTAIAGFVTGLFGPAAKLIDNVSTTDEERLTLRNELAKIESTVQTKLIELETAQLKATQSVIIAETNSDNTIVKCWRPCTIILLITIVILGSFKIIETPPEIWKLLEGFLYIYGSSRGIEKVTSIYKARK